MGCNNTTVVIDDIKETTGVHKRFVLNFELASIERIGLVWSCLRGEEDDPGSSSERLWTLKEE